MDGVKFKRQVPRGNFVVDFLSDEAMLIIELDGSQHAEKTEEDEKRTAYLESLGYLVIRFWNGEFLKNTQGALENTYEKVCERRKAPSSGLRPPSPRGEKDTTTSPAKRRE
jgi:very-short-patch-repair endonuclease